MLKSAVDQWGSTLYGGFYGGPTPQQVPAALHPLEDGRVLAIVPGGQRGPSSSYNAAFMDTHDSYIWLGPDVEIGEYDWQGANATAWVGFVSPEGCVQLSAEQTAQRFDGSTPWASRDHANIPSQAGDTLFTTPIWSGVWVQEYSTDDYVVRSFCSFVYDNYLYIWNFKDGRLNRFLIDDWTTEHVAGNRYIDEYHWWSFDHYIPLNGISTYLDSSVGTSARLGPYSNMVVNNESVYWLEPRDHNRSGGETSGHVNGNEEHHFLNIRKMDLGGSNPISTVFESQIPDYSPSYESFDAGRERDGQYIFLPLSYYHGWAISIAVHDDYLYIAQDSWLYRWPISGGPLETIISGAKGREANISNAEWDLWEPELCSYADDPRDEDRYVRKGTPELEGLLISPSCDIMVHGDYLYAVNVAGGAFALQVNYSEELYVHFGNRGVRTNDRAVWTYTAQGDRIIRFHLPSLVSGPVNREEPQWETIAGGTFFEDTNNYFNKKYHSMTFRFGNNPILANVRALAYDPRLERVWFDMGRTVADHMYETWFFGSGDPSFGDWVESYNLVGYLEPTKDKFDVSLQFSGKALKNYPTDVGVPPEVFLSVQ